jgi:hypothetical protein
MKQGFTEIIQFDRVESMVRALIDQISIEVPRHELPPWKLALFDQDRSGAHGASEVAGVGRLNIEVNGEFPTICFWGYSSHFLRYSRYGADFSFPLWGSFLSLIS